MIQTSTTQSDPIAISHPSGVDSSPPAAPELHHYNDYMKHFHETQVRSNGVAPPVNGSVPGNDDHLAFIDLPPFPRDVPTAPLVRLNLQRLLDHDPNEEEKLWRACCDLGFFYLDLRGALPSTQDSFHKGAVDGDGLLQDADKLFHLGEEFFQLPLEEKNRYDNMAKGSYFGYKASGSGVLDSKGTRDRVEFYNTSKDDILGISDPLPAPDILQRDESRTLFKSYMQRSHAVISLLLGQLNDKLGLPPSTLPSLHRLQGNSGDQVRWVRSPPQPMDDGQLALGEHTDFGSVTILFNRLGGLQILPPGDQQQWCYVQPLEGHCVVNLGDAMVKFSAGILRSNIHRVVSPPGEQGDLTRISLVYFGRPEDEVILKVLDGSDMINQKRKQLVEFAGEEQVTAKEWILRRAMGKRVGGDYSKSGGTEGNRLKHS